MAIVSSTVSVNFFLDLAEPRYAGGYLIENVMLNKSPAVSESVPHSVFVVL